MVLVISVVAGPLVGTRPAAACSCAVQTARDAIAATGTAVVGRTEPRPDEDPDDGVLVWRVEVEEVLAGAVEPVIEVRTADGSTTCGPDGLAPRQGMVLWTDRQGRWTTGSCGAPFTLEELRAAVAPLPPSGTAPAVALATAQYGAVGVLGLDVMGQVVGYGVGTTPIHLLAPCPGGDFVAAVVHTPDVHVEVRDLTTLRPVADETERIGGVSGAATVAAACRDGQAADVDVLVRDDGSEVPLWTVVGRTPADTLFLGAADAAALDPSAPRVVAVAGSAVVAVDVGPPVVRARIDEGLELARLDDGLEPLAVAVDRAGRIAVVLGRTEQQWHQRAEEVVLLDGDGVLVARTPLGPDRWTTSAAWLADGRLAIPTRPGAQAWQHASEVLLVDAAGGLTAVGVPGVPSSAAAVAGGLLVTTDVGLVRVDGTGAAAVVGPPEATVWSIAALDGPTALDAPAPPAVPGAVVPPSPDDPAPDGTSAGGDRGVPGISAEPEGDAVEPWTDGVEREEPSVRWWRVVGLLGACLLVAIGALLARRSLGRQRS